MTANASLATIAEYFRLGLQIGLLEPAQAVAWADSQIEAADSAPEGFIDISWSKGLASTMDALSAVPGERNIQLSGRWLLGLIGQSIPESVGELQNAVRCAMHIARHAELGEEIYYRFDMIDDELSLARTKVYGTIDQCRLDFAAELAEYSALDLDAAV